MVRIACLALSVLLSSGVVGAETGPEAELHTLSCIPTAGVWHASPGSSPRMVVPNLAVVDTDIRPERARLYLDGRFIGTADHFDGHPDYLYLKPGSYRLEARFGGWVTAVFEIEAGPGCRSHIRHRMPRAAGTEKEGRGTQPDYPVPFKRVYEPVVGQGGEEGAGGRRHRGRPDPSLRPDLARRLGSAPAAATEARAGAALRVRVEPSNASLYVDGVFVATAEELAGMVEPLAVAPGHHLIAVLAPGYAPQEREIEIEPGDVLELRVVLETTAADPP